MWWFGRKSQSGFTGSSTAEEVTNGIDGTGLTAIVTGASSGIGAQTTRVLALRGVHVVMAVRNTSAGREVRDKIVQEIHSAKIDIMELDLSSMESVRKFASDYKSSNIPLNILINNAGVLATPFTLSQDNTELHFAINYLGHFLLTHLLMDTMKITACESGREGRIINVTSEGYRMAYSEGILFDKLNDPSLYNGFRAYGQSKLANILHSRELAKVLKEDGAEVTANSVHPGVVYTNLFRYNSLMDGLVRMFGKYVFNDVQHGAATVCYLALHPQVRGISGEYFSNCSVSKLNSQAQDEILARKLWEFSLNKCLQLSVREYNSDFGLSCKL